MVQLPGLAYYSDTRKNLSQLTLAKKGNSKAVVIHIFSSLHKGVTDYHKYIQAFSISINT